MPSRRMIHYGYWISMKEVVVHCLQAALSPDPSNLAVNLKPQYALSNEALKRVLSLVWHLPDHSYTGC
jgi:hypothetical protein